MTKLKGKARANARKKAYKQKIAYGKTQAGQMMGERFVRDAHVALRRMLDADLIKFDEAPYWFWLDDTTRLNVLPNSVEFQTANQTLEIDVRETA